MRDGSLMGMVMCTAHAINTSSTVCGLFSERALEDNGHISSPIII